MGGARLTRFVFAIPAHNEELLLPRLLASIRNQDYPSERFDAIVVADNCTDGTANAARKLGGIVLERVDEARRGKGYAIKWAVDSIDLDKYDAVLIVDADCVISPNALRSLDGAMQKDRVIQCYSGVANPDENWFTRLLDVSRTINNDIYSSAKQRLGLSTQLIGTGMCFPSRVLKRFGWDAFTVAEDCEYYALLVRNGETVGFCWDAKVLHQESSSLKQATSQRMRSVERALRGRMERWLQTLATGNNGTECLQIRCGPGIHSSESVSGHEYHLGLPGGCACDTARVGRRTAGVESFSWH